MSTFIGRTSWIGTLENKERNGKPHKSLLFRMAVERDYFVNKRDAKGNPVNGSDGQPIKERPTDFFLFSARDELAQILFDNCGGRRAVEGGGDKMISRFLALEGHIETYVATRKVPTMQRVNIEGKEWDLSFEVDVEHDAFIIVVDKIRHFLDPKPEDMRKEKPVAAVSAAPVIQGVPVVAAAPQPAPALTDAVADKNVQGFIPVPTMSSDDNPF